jgi:hypothetical protein
MNGLYSRKSPGPLVSDSRHNCRRHAKVMNCMFFSNETQVKLVALQIIQKSSCHQCPFSHRSKATVGSFLYATDGCFLPKATIITHHQVNTLQYLWPEGTLFDG